MSTTAAAAYFSTAITRSWRRLWDIGFYGRRACRSGWVAVVHDPEARGMLVPGAPLPLMLAALRCNRPAAAVELQLKKAEVQSVRYRLDMASGKDMASA